VEVSEGFQSLDLRHFITSNRMEKQNSNFANFYVLSLLS